jgi:hypothetical protein
MKLLLCIVALIFATVYAGPVSCQNGNLGASVLDNEIKVTSCDGLPICQQSCRSIYVKCFGNSATDSVEAKYLSDGQAWYFTPAYPINILLQGLEDFYTQTCVVHKTTRANLDARLDFLSKSFVTAKFAPQISSLSKNGEFRTFWANQIDFCKKQVNGLYPSDRAVVNFFNHHFTAPTMALIAKLNVTDIKVPLTGTSGPMVPKFISSLAAWSTRGHMARCPCGMLTNVVASGRYADGSDASAMKAKYGAGWMNYEIAKQKMCLAKYPTFCKLTPLGAQLLGKSAGSIPFTPKTAVKKAVSKKH